MDRVIVYPGSVPLDTHILQPQRNAEIALGMIMRSAFGIGTVIDGLAVTQQASPNMTVQVGQGCIITQTVIDPTGVAFGSLPLDASTNLVKVGINIAPVNMSALTAPSTAGQSQNWLIEAQFLEADGLPVVLPYYDAATPSLPYTGPANSGTSQNTRRANTVQLQWKAGTAAATGSQNTPAPDSGWVGVAIVTVTNGQSTILNANITPYSAAPYVPTKLPFQRWKLTSNLTVYVSTTGNDTNNSGLSGASPFLTLQRAWNYISASLDLNGYQVTVSCANGTYTAGVYATGALVGGSNSNVSLGFAPVVFQGNTGSPSSCTINVANGNIITAAAGAWLAVTGFTLLAGGTGPNGNALLAQTFGIIVNGGSNVFGTCTNNHMLAFTNGFILSAAAYAITGGASYHLNSSASGQIEFAPPATITLTGTPAFSVAYALANQDGTISITGSTFSGSATGARYSCLYGGNIYTAGAGASYLPGSTPGAAPTGYYA